MRRVLPIRPYTHALRVVCVLLVAVLGAVSCRPRTKPLEVSFWYWHSPFQLSPKQVDELKQLHVQRLFVHGGTFTHRKVGVQMLVRQTWKEGTGAFPVVLVFNYDSGLLSHFETLDLDAAASTMAACIRESAEEAQRGGARVEGVQLDIDAPTRLLPKYAALLHQTRLDLGRPDWSFSVTALSSWLHSRYMASIAREVDYLAPQFYESEVAFKESQPSTLSDLRALRSGLHLAANLDKPFYAGLASYGRAMLYDDRGNLAAIYHGATPEEALRHPAFRFQSTVPLDGVGGAATRSNYVGEDKVTLLAVQPGRNGKGMGYHLVYDLPSTQLVSNQMVIAHDEAPENCEGVIFYRLPSEEDPFALSVDSVAAGVEGFRPETNLLVKADVSPNPWRAVEGGTPLKDIRVCATNAGADASAACPGAVQVLLVLPKPGLAMIEPGEFDSATPVRRQGSTLTRCELSDANAVLLKRSHLLASQSISSGPISVSCPGPYRTESYVLPPGEEVAGAKP